MVTISIFEFFLKHEKDAIFVFYEKYALKNFRIWLYV
jgi:hypothetical protein